MAGRGDIEAGRAFVSLYMKSSLHKGLLAAKAQLKDFGDSAMRVGKFIASLGAGITAPLAAAVTHFVRFGSELTDLAARTGMTVGSLAELKFAAEQTGAGIEDIEIAVKMMQKKGITETFDQVAARIAAIEDPAERTRMALETWGKSGTKLLPMLESLQALRQEARDSGLVPSDEAVAAADRMGDAFDKFKSIVLAAAFSIGGALAPVLEPAVKLASDLAKSFNRWAQTNGQVIRTVALIGVGMLAVGGLVLAVGAAATGLSVAVGAVASVLAGAVALLTSPVAIVIGLLAAGVAAWLRFTESGRAAAQAVGEQVGLLFGTLSETWQGVVDALAAGDLQLAAEVAFAGLKLAWHQGTQELNRMWLDAKFFFLTVWQEAQTGLAKLFVSAFSAIQRGWVQTVSFLQSVWTSFSTTLLNGFQRAQQGIGNLIIAAAEKSGAVSKEFAQAWRDSLNAPIDEAVTNRNDAAGAQQAEIEKRRRDRLAQIDADEAGMRKGLDDDKERALRERDQDRNAGIRAKQQALDEARRALTSARERAATEREETEKKKKPQGAIDAAASLGAAATVTFSGAALAAAGQGGGAADMARDIRKQVLIQKNQEKYLKTIAESEGAVAK